MRTLLLAMGVVLLVGATSRAEFDGTITACVGATRATNLANKRASSIEADKAAALLRLVKRPADMPYIGPKIPMILEDRSYGVTVVCRVLEITSGGPNAQAPIFNRPSNIPRPKR
jgi:hypothetical protein